MKKIILTLFAVAFTGVLVQAQDTNVNATNAVNKQATTSQSATTAVKKATTAQSTAPNYKKAEDSKGITNLPRVMNTDPDNPPATNPQAVKELTQAVNEANAAQSKKSSATIEAERKQEVIEKAKANPKGNN